LDLPYALQRIQQQSDSLVLTIITRSNAYMAMAKDTTDSKALPNRRRKAFSTPQKQPAPKVAVDVIELFQQKFI
jgi:hypothetical protein